MKNRNSIRRSTFAILFVSVLSLTLPGCGKQVEDWVGGIERPPLLTPPISFKAAGASEFVSGSRPYSQTIQRGYFVSAAVGGFQAEVVQTSTQRGYKVFSSVQGVMLSESDQQ